MYPTVSRAGKSRISLARRVRVDDPVSPVDEDEPIHHAVHHAVQGGAAALGIVDELGICDGDANLVANGDQQVFICLRKVAMIATLDIQQAQHFPPGKERQTHARVESLSLASCAAARGMRCDVGNQVYLPRLEGSTADAFARADDRLGSDERRR